MKKKAIKYLKISSRRRGFSLQEMLIVIAIIGVISFIALPIVTSFKEQAQEAVAKRNAQLLSQTAAAAGAIGNDAIAKAGSKPAAIAFLVNGLSEGPYDNTLGVPGLSLQEQKAAAAYLSYNHGLLSFVSGGAANLPASEQGPDDAQDYNNGGGQYAAQVLVGAAAGVTDPNFASSGGVGSAITFMQNSGNPSVSSLSDADIQSSISYLTWENNTLAFRP